mgnify:CR=1 FL=1
MADLKETTATMLAEGEKPENQTGQMVMHVFRCLVSKFRKMGRSPINYFRFVLGPTCFGTSIENMFLVSFLVKEGKVVCQETVLPMITPKSTKNKEQEEHKKQVVMNVSMDDWRRMVK